MSLTKQQAISAMRGGKKVTHDLFSPGEWVTMPDDFNIITEEGYMILAVEFWLYRNSEAFETGWYIWGE